MTGTEDRSLAAVVYSAAYKYGHVVLSVIKVK